METADARRVSIPQRRAIEKAIQQSLARMLTAGMKYRILHHASRPHYGLQVADYCCWAVFRKLQRGDTEHYDRIKPAVRSEDDFFGMPRGRRAD